MSRFFWLHMIIALALTAEDGYESPYEDNISRIHPYLAHHLGVNHIQESQTMDLNAEINQQGSSIYTTFT